MDTGKETPEFTPPGKRGVATVSQPNLECESLLAYAESLGIDVRQFETKMPGEESSARRDIGSAYNLERLAAAVADRLKTSHGAA